MAVETGFGIPKARLQSLSDLIFGLALSIGAFSLISSGSNSPDAILPNVLAFGFSFLILVIMWARYTRLTAVLPFETRGTVVLNVVMLFFVAVEPYLFNQLFSFNYTAFDANLTETYYAVDLASLFLCLGYLTHVLITKNGSLLSDPSRKLFTSVRDLELVSAAFFLVSTLPVFWAVTLFGVPTRFYLWIFPLLLGRARTLLSGTLKSPNALNSSNHENTPKPT